MITKKRNIILALLATSALAMADKIQARNAFSDAFSELAGGDQAEFIATVNRSLADRSEPLDEHRIKTLYRINRDAVRGALAPAAPAAQKYLPVLYASVDEDDPSSPEWRLYQAEGGNDANVGGTVAGYLAHAPQGAWRPLGGQDRAQVDNCFMALMEQATAAGGPADGTADSAMRRQRVHDEMLRLYHQSNPLTCTTTR